MNDIILTPLLLKNSLLMSVIIKTTGHNRTPSDRLSVKFLNPNRDMFTADEPNVFSKENIFISINSASNAFATKYTPKTKNKLLLLFCI